MPLDVPFRLGPFLVDTHGRLEPGEPDRFPSFRMSWRGCPVQARLHDGWQDGGDAAQLALSAMIGRVPSTAGGDAAHHLARRKAAFAALREMDGGRALLRLRLLPDHRIVMEGHRAIALPLSAVDLLTQATCFLLDLGPYLDLLAEAGMPLDAAGSGAPVPGGTVNT